MQFYTKTTHYLHKDITQYMQTLRKYVYAGITQISHAYAITLRRYYADITQINYAIITHITQSLRKNYADFTPINYAIHYADYAIQLLVRKYDHTIPQNVITQITQIPIISKVPFE